MTFQKENKRRAETHTRTQELSKPFTKTWRWTVMVRGGHKMGIFLFESPTAWKLVKISVIYWRSLLGLGWFWAFSRRQYAGGQQKVHPWHLSTPPAPSTVITGQVGSRDFLGQYGEAGAGGWVFPFRLSGFVQFDAFSSPRAGSCGMQARVPAAAEMWRDLCSLVGAVERSVAGGCKRVLGLFGGRWYEERKTFEFS